MGWGDRLIAAFATPSMQLYVGTDPNLSNAPLYESIQKKLAPLRHHLGGILQQALEVNLYSSPAEDFRPYKLYGETFDLVFTSCPYFSLEKYAYGSPHEHLQSWKRYPSFTEWFEKFLCASINNALESLKPGGYFVLNLSDYKRKGKRQGDLRQAEFVSREFETLKLHWLCGNALAGPIWSQTGPPQNEVC